MPPSQIITNKYHKKRSISAGEMYSTYVQNGPMIISVLVDINRSTFNEDTCIKNYF